MERLFESIEFYILTTSGQLRLNVTYINSETLEKISEDIEINTAEVKATEAVILLANKLLDKAGK